MALVDDCIESFERRVVHLNETLVPLENGHYDIGRREPPGGWVCVTEAEIIRLRHEIRETETIIATLKARRARAAGQVRIQPEPVLDLV